MWLEDEQKELLGKFVEAHRSAPREKRAGFLASSTHSNPQASFIHLRVHGLGFSGNLSDAEVLAAAGLLAQSSNRQGDPIFSVAPDGIQYYEQLQGSSQPLEAFEASMQTYLSGTEFRALHESAFKKWEQAAELLWSADSEQQYTAIGHHCREALQAFVASLATAKHVDLSQVEPQKTIARLQTVVKEHKKNLGKTEFEFLDALIMYWRTVSDLVQRQEHGALREKQQLVWADARRVVFQTCVLMFEVSQALVRK